MRAFCARALLVGEQTNCVSEEDYASAIAQAKVADQMYEKAQLMKKRFVDGGAARGGHGGGLHMSTVKPDLPPLLGLPISVKETTDQEGKSVYLPSS